MEDGSHQVLMKNMWILISSHCWFFVEVTSICALISVKQVAYKVLSVTRISVFNSICCSGCFVVYVSLLLIYF